MIKITKIQPLLFSLFFIFLFSGILKAQQSETVGKLTRFEVKAEFLDEFKEALSSYVTTSISKDGNIMSEAYFEKEKPSTLWLIERWKNVKESEKFNSASEMNKIISLSKKALTNPVKIIKIKDLEPLSKEEWRRASRKEDNQLTIMLFVDAKKGTQQNFKDVYHVAMPQFRSEPRVVTYQLSEIENDPTQFVTYEKFRGDDAFQYHLKFPPIQPVIDYLNSSIKEQPFQKGIHNLIEFAPLIRE